MVTEVAVQYGSYVICLMTNIYNTEELGIIAEYFISMLFVCDIIFLHERIMVKNYVEKVNSVYNDTSYGMDGTVISRACLLKAAKEL